MAEFLTKNADVALVEVKEKLYERLGKIRVCLIPDGPIDNLDHHMTNEIKFLEDLLDIIERST